MASREIFLRDDDENIINQKTQKRYALNVSKGDWTTPERQWNELE